MHPAFKKFGRGLANVFGGWLEVPTAVHRRYSEHNTAGSMLTGTAYGLYKGAIRTGVGFYEILSFFAPYPAGFAPILPTQEYYQHEKRRDLPLG